MSTTKLLSLLLQISALRIVVASTQYQQQPLLQFRTPRTTDPDDAGLRFHEVTFLASHNAHANRVAAFSFFEIMGINQDTSIYDQLAVDGVRGLLLDIKLDESRTDEPLRLVHDPFDYGGFSSQMEENLIPFLINNENAVVVLYLETKADTDTGSDGTIRATILEHLKNIFSSLVVNDIPLKDLTFRYDDKLWKNHDDWPTMNELRLSKQRLFVFTDRSEIANSDYGFMHNEQVMQENDWRGIESCTGRFMWQSLKVSLPSNDRWSRLFMMNHYCCESGAESIATVIPDPSPLLGGGDNGWGILYPRIKMCMENNGGVKPNFIALDWVVEDTEARSIVQFMNFGGALGTRQLCDNDDVCATLSCNNALGQCQCRECSEESQEVCAGCESGQYCYSPGDGSANECRSLSQQQQLKQSSNRTSYCAETYSQAIDNCTIMVPCPMGNSDCPGNQVCFGSIDCLPRPTLQPSESSPSESISNQPSIFTTESLSSSAALTSIQPSIVPSESLAQMNSTSLSPLPSLTPTLISLASQNAVGRYCGGSYESAKETCNSETACPGGYECPAGQTCFDGIKCFTNPPSNSPTLAPVTLSPSDSPTQSPTTLAPISPTSSPTLKPTRAPFDFANEYFCGTNFTDAQFRCYNTTPCPGGDPSVCDDGQTCFNSIKCIAPPSISPTLMPTGNPPTRAPGSKNWNVEGSTTAPFVWPKEVVSPSKNVASIGWNLVVLSILIALVVGW